MKKIIFLLIAMIGFGVANAQTTPPLEFKESKFSFGKIKQNIPVTHIFTFKNVSGKVAVIESATAGCGCTTPEFPKEPIMKGGTNKISVTFNAQTMGAFTKQVTVKLANVAEPIVLTIEGEVIEAGKSKVPKK